MSPLAPNSKYWFILGRESIIAAAELDAVLGLKTYDFIAPILKTKVATDPAILMRQLGGTIKIAKEIGHNVKAKELEEIMIAELKTVPGKINFGISVYTSDKNNFTDLKLKLSI